MLEVAMHGGILKSLLGQGIIAVVLIGWLYYVDPLRKQDD